MPVFSLLPFAKPAFNIAQNLLSKQKAPKREDFVQNTDFIKRFIANLRSRKESSEVQNLLLQPELRRIGAEGRSATRDIERNFARVGAPEGAIAEARTGIARTTIQGISEATGKARAAQLQQNRQFEERIDRALLQEGSIQSRGDLFFKRAKTGFEESERRRKIGLLGSFADLAVAGLGELRKSKSLKEGLLNRAKSEGVLPPEATFEDLKNIGVERFGIEPGTGEAGKETLRGLLNLKSISSKAASAFQKEFGGFDSGVINQAISNAGLQPATLRSGDFSKISREIKKLQLGNFQRHLQTKDLNLDTIFEDFAKTAISEKQFNILLKDVEKTTGETLSTVQKETLNIFTSDITPVEKVAAIDKKLDDITLKKDSTFVLSLFEKARRQESQALTAAERETKKRTDVTEGGTRISEMLTDISNTKLFPEQALGEEGLDLPSGVEKSLRARGFDPQSAVAESKTFMNETLQKLERDGTITKDEISNFQAALSNLIETANIPTGELSLLFPDIDSSERAKLALLERFRNRFRRILNLFDITIPEEQDDVSGLSTGDFIDKLRPLVGGSGQ